MPEGLLIEFVVDCPECGETASAGNTLFTDWEPGAPFQIDLEMSAAQIEFRCTDVECGVVCYAGDYQVYSEGSSR